MSNYLNKNGEYRYEMFGLGMGEPAFYLSPSAGHREYLLNVWGIYQATPDEPIIRLSDNGTPYDLLVVFANHKLAKIHESINSTQDSDLTVIDPHRKANSFSGKLLLFGELQNEIYLLWFIDATEKTPKSLSVYIDRFDFPEVRNLLMLFARRFSALGATAVEQILQDNPNLFIPTSSDVLSPQKK